MHILTIYGDELYHHGILGQKWGLRRFQNKDGTWTAEGKQRRQEYRMRSKLYEGKRAFDDKHLSAYKEHNEKLKKLGLNANGKDQLLRKEDFEKQRMSFFRQTGAIEDVGSKRKYVSFTPYDNQTYEEETDLLPQSPDSDGRRYRELYKPIKDIKVAGETEVKRYLLNKYGDVKLKDTDKFLNEHKMATSGFTFNTYKEMHKEGEMPLYKEIKKYKNSSLKELYELTNNTEGGSTIPISKLEKISKTGSKDERMAAAKVVLGIATARDILSGGASSTLIDNDETFDYFKKKGYDAILDLEDYEGGMEYPIILLSPKDSVKKVGSERIK